ncbi:MAG: hypothetical protein ACK5KP_03210 [Paludibacteraceae bacterium]
MKKRFLLITILILSITLISAQQIGKIGSVYSIGAGSSLTGGVKGSASYEITRASGAGLVYLYRINNTIDWETGVSYSLYNIKTTPTEGIEREVSYSAMSLIDIPLGVRTTFDDYIFLNGGLLLGFGLNNTATFDTQSGIGLYGGLGGVYDFRFGGSVFVNPYLKLHSLFPFTQWTYHARLLEYGVRLGFTYKF